MRRTLLALVPATLLCVAATTAPARADVTPSPSPSSSVDTSTLRQPTSDSAMLNMLGQQGVDYYPITDLNEALSGANSGTTLVISDGEFPSTDDLTQISDAGFGRIIILNNDASTVSTLIPGVTVKPYTNPLRQPTSPSCSQADAAAAGSVAFEDNTAAFDVSEADTSGGPIVGCYLVNGASSLVSYDSGGTSIIALGSSTFTENVYLTEAGNAALALRVFGAHSKLVWYAPSFTPDVTLNNCGGNTCGSGGNQTPQPGSTTTIPAGGGGSGGGSNASGPTLTSLMPSWIWWALLQLFVAVLLTAYWRGRRLGAVVTEQLPVTVRAAETVEGHARLYRRANAHGRAAELLRKATASRLAVYCGVPSARAHADPSVLIAPVAARLQVGEDLVADLLAGAAPQSEAELVLLADHLDQLEQEVRSS